MVDITSASFQPTAKAQSGAFSGASGVVQVIQGTDGYNHWSFNVDASSFKTDKYIVTVSGITVDVTGSRHSTLLNDTNDQCNTCGHNGNTRNNLSVDNGPGHDTVLSP